MISQPMSHIEKLSWMLQNLSKYPQDLHIHIKSLSQILQSSSIDTKSLHPALLIKIQTLYQLVQPAISHLHWQQPHQNNLYPVTLIIAPLLNHNASSSSKSTISDSSQFSVQYKLVTWIQSGGTRCIVIKYKINDSQQQLIQQMQKYMALSHCAVIANLPVSHTQTEYHKHKKWIQLFLQVISKEKYYPVLIMGECSKYAIDVLSNDKASYGNMKQDIGQLSISFQSQLFKGLQLQNRLYFQTKCKTYSPVLELTSLPESLQMHNLHPSVWWSSPKHPNKPRPLILQPLHQIQSQKSPIFIVLSSYLCLLQSPQSIELWHCLIINFINTAKKYKKQIDEKKIDRLLIANWKVIFGSNNGIQYGWYVAE